jgi:hypothetical protein
VSVVERLRARCGFQDGRFVASVVQGGLISGWRVGICAPAGLIAVTISALAVAPDIASLVGWAVAARLAMNRV